MIHACLVGERLNLCIHMTAHSNRVTVRRHARTDGKYISHLIHFDLASQRLALCDKPIPDLFVLLSQRQTTHARTSRKSSPLRAGTLQRLVKPVAIDFQL
jgi:hypothetical protein